MSPMPEGHTIHRLARDLSARLGSGTLRASALQPRFAAGVARIDGGRLVGTDAWGKHLFLKIAPPAAPQRPDWLHVHLGLYGRFAHGLGPPPQARGQLRLRLVTDTGWADLRGATACELLDPGQRRVLLAGLGPDPLRRGTSGDAAYARIARSRVSIGALLMQQDVVAGIGNVYRAEILFRHGIDPYRPGRDLPRETWDAVWADLVALMRLGVRTGRIVTTRPEDRPPGRRRVAPSRVRTEDAHYVYRRTGLPCRVCGSPVVTAEMVARNLYWCPKDQQS